MNTPFLFNAGFVNQLEGVERKRYLQQIRVVKTLYQEGAQTTSNLCNKLKISAPNMMAMLNEMVEKGVIEKKGQGESIGGRKPDLYGVVSDNFYIVAVDMGIYKTRISVYNAENKQIDEVKEYSIALNKKTEAFEFAVKAINAYIEQSGVDRNKIIGVGISQPGLIDSVKGINHTYLCFDDVPLAVLLEKRIGIPVFLENDANAIALAEFRLGVARNKKDVLVLYMDWGIGLGMILNGQLYRGTSGFAGEFSHIPMVENGKLCSCGKLGCIDTIASGLTILNKVEEGIKEGKTSIVFEESEAKHQYRELKKVIHAALNGDQYAISVLNDTGKNLGKGISILIQLFNPELIVLCGKMAESGELIINPIRQGVHVHAMKQISEKANIAISEFGNNIGIYGALAVVMENVFDQFIVNAEELVNK